MATKSHDLVVIGAGPGGYVAAIRAAQRHARRSPCSATESSLLARAVAAVDARPASKGGPLGSRPSFNGAILSEMAVAVNR